MADKYIADPLSKRDIFKLTSEIRERLNLNKSLFFPIVEVIELFITQFDDNFNYEIIDEDRMPYGTYAYYDAKCNCMKIRNDVYCNATNNIGRDRFTLAHELGHYFLHQTGVGLCRASEPIKSYQNPEWQANTFASFLLMPPNLIVNMPPETISLKCGTSMEASVIAHKKSRELS